MKQLLIALLIFSVSPMSVFAHDDGRSQITQNVQNITQVNKYYTTNDVTGVALAIAHAQIQFDATSYSLQVGVGVGNYNSDNAFAVGVGKRLCEHCPMINATIGRENGKTGAGAGITFRF